MERLKNFFYSKNDILIALLILAIALSIIGYRVSKILEYPSTLVEEQVMEVQEEQQAPVSSSPENKSSTDEDKEKSSTDTNKENN